MHAMHSDCKFPQVLIISQISTLTFPVPHQNEINMTDLCRTEKDIFLYTVVFFREINWLFTVSSNFPLAEDLITDDTHKILPQTKTWENLRCVWLHGGPLICPCGGQNRKSKRRAVSVNMLVLLRFYLQSCRWMPEWHDTVFLGSAAGGT